MLKRVLLGFLKAGLILVITCGNIYSIGSSISLEGKDPEATNELVKKSLEKIGAGYTAIEETNGFAYHYEDTFFTPYNFNIYIGSFETGRTLIRVDSSNRMSYALNDIFLQENGQGPFPKKYGTKSWLLGDMLNLVSPAFGHLYANYDSPFARDTAWVKTFYHIGLDLIFLWVGGKTFFTHGFDPTGRGLVATGILMGGYRLATLGPIHMQMVAQNRLVEMKYSFRF